MKFEYQIWIAALISVLLMGIPGGVLIQKEMELDKQKNTIQRLESQVKILESESPQLKSL